MVRLVGTIHLVLGHELLGLKTRGLLLASASTRYTNVHVPLRLHRPQHPSLSTLGTMTRYPFLPSMGVKPLPSKKRYSTKNVLPRHGILAWNPSVQKDVNRVSELSLFGEPKCLSLQTEHSTLTSH